MYACSIIEYIFRYFRLSIRLCIRAQIVKLSSDGILRLYKLGYVYMTDWFLEIEAVDIRQHCVFLQANVQSLNILYLI